MLLTDLQLTTSGPVRPAALPRDSTAAILYYAERCEGGNFDEENGAKGGIRGESSELHENTSHYIAIEKQRFNSGNNELETNRKQVELHNNANS